MAGLHFTVKQGDPATEEKDAINHLPYLPGEEAVDCGRHHYFHVESWREVNEICPLDLPSISTTKKSLLSWQKVTLYVVSIAVAIGTLFICIAATIAGSSGIAPFLSMLFPTAVMQPEPTSTFAAVSNPPTAYPTYTPYPTQTKPPTYTPLPTYTSLPATSMPTRVSLCPTPMYFQGIWRPNSQLGCPVTSSTSDFTFQKFQGGLMIWRKSPDPSTIYALYYSDQRWERQTDPGGPPIPSCPEAERTVGFGPIYSFGKLWCKPWDWKARLGQPLDKEQDGRNNPIQNYQNGLAFTVGSAGGFVLYSNSIWSSFEQGK
jgi:hypothetical protein